MKDEIELVTLHTGHKHGTENTQGADLISKWMLLLYLPFKVKSNVKNSFNSPYSVLEIFKCQTTETHKIYFKISLIL